MYKIEDIARITQLVDGTGIWHQTPMENTTKEEGLYYTSGSPDSKT
jgi:hypothetical protein